MGENLAGRLYIDGKILTSIEDVELVEEVYDPDENTLECTGIRRIEPMEITFTVTCNANRFRKMFAKCFMGWKNYEKPRKRTKEKAIKHMYRSISFMSEARIRRLQKRYLKKLRSQRRRDAGGGA